MIAKTVQGVPSDCHLDCASTAGELLDRRRWQHVPADHALLDRLQRGLLPRIPLDALKPTHPWAVQLVDWIRNRVDAGQNLVEALFAPDTALGCGS